MNILLVNSPKSVYASDLMLKLPNLGLNSISANLNSIHTVKILDLHILKTNHEKMLFETIKSFAPDLIGFSGMTFQFPILLEYSKKIKNLDKKILTVIGGYHVTTANNYEENREILTNVDFLLKGEAEFTFNELVSRIHNRDNLSDIPGIIYLSNDEIINNPQPPNLNLETISLPDRDNRIIKKGFHVFGRKADSVETSRGCVFDCSFCSITKMYGKTFRKFPIERVMEDIKKLREDGVKFIFFVDDNITLNTKHAMEVFEGIIKNGFNDINYGTQASIQGLKKEPELIKTMKRANADHVYLGLESSSDETLEFYQKTNQMLINDSEEIIKKLKINKFFIVGGFVVGQPEDTEKTIMNNLDYAKKVKIDVPAILALTPYPGTEIREFLDSKNLIENKNNFEKYTPHHVNIRTNHLSYQEFNILFKRIGNIYLTYTGAIWRLIKKYPIYIAKIIVIHFLESPKYMLRTLRYFFFRT